jgi:hypothetical protein
MGKVDVLGGEFSIEKREVGLHGSRSASIQPSYGEYDLFLLPVAASFRIYI